MEQGALWQPATTSWVSQRIRSDSDGRTPLLAGPVRHLIKRVRVLRSGSIFGKECLLHVRRRRGGRVRWAHHTGVHKDGLTEALAATAWCTGGAATLRHALRWRCARHGKVW